MRLSVKIKCVLFCVGVLWGGGANADTLLPDLELVKSFDRRLTGYNAAGLHVLPVRKVAVAEGFFSKETGGFVDYYQSGSSRRWGMSAESFSRVSDRIVLYGQIEYQNLEGKNMGGSVFINPSRQPFDLVEWSDSTQGKKQMDQYALAGAISASLTPKLWIGGKINYRAANYTKVKDLRHKTTLMDLTLTVGPSYRLTEKTEVGLNYLYRRSTESVSFGVYGNTDQLYYTLVSYGAFFGKREVAGDTGYTSVDNEKPLFNAYHGGSVQVNHAFTPAVSLLSEFTYLSRTGYYGVRSPSSIVYSNHVADIFEYRGDVVLRKKKNAWHRFGITLTSEKLKNYENVYKQETTEGGNKDIVYYDETTMQNRTLSAMKIEYEGRFGLDHFNPRWLFRSSITGAGDNKTVSVYPYYRKQEIKTFEATVFLRRSFYTKRYVYSLAGGLLYGSGGGHENQDGVYVAPTESQSKPATADYLLHHQYEYATAKRAGASVKLRISIPLQNGLRGYAEAGGTLVKGFKLRYIPDDTSTTFTVKVGCHF